MLLIIFGWKYRRVCCYGSVLLVSAILVENSQLRKYNLIMGLLRQRNVGRISQESNKGWKCFPESIDGAAETLTLNFYHLPPFYS